MNFKLIRYIASKLTKSNTESRFLGFSRGVAFLGIVLGTLALTVSLSVLDGFDFYLKENASKFSAHIIISNNENGIIYNSDNLCELISKKFPEIKKTSSLIQKEILIKSRNSLEGVLLRGTDTNKDITELLKNNIISGRNFSEKSKDTSNKDLIIKEIIIGEGLAKKLGVDINDKLTLYALKSEALTSGILPEIDQYVICGIYKTGFSQYDESIVFVPYESAANLLHINKNYSTNIEILLTDINSSSQVVEKISKFIGRSYYTTTIFETHWAMFSWIELQKAPIPIVLGFIIIVAVFNIITMLLIVIVEKINSIGILRSLGLNSSSIASIFITQGLMIAVFGSLLGCGLGLLLGTLQQQFSIISLKGDIYFLDTLPIKFYWWHFIVIISSTISLALMSSLIPSFIATKINTIKALRYK